MHFVWRLTLSLQLCERASLTWRLGCHTFAHIFTISTCGMGFLGGIPHERPGRRPGEEIMIHTNCMKNFIVLKWMINPTNGFHPNFSHSFCHDWVPVYLSGRRSELAILGQENSLGSVPCPLQTRPSMTRRKTAHLNVRLYSTHGARPDTRRRFQHQGRWCDCVSAHSETGGTTFGRHLVRNIRLEQPCDCKAGQKKCTCHRPGKQESWLFSRFSTGWSCGLHADWTELTTACLW